MKTKVKVLIVVLSLFAIWKIAEACGYVDLAEDTRIYTFEPKLNNYNDFKPFFYNADLINGNVLGIPQENIDEWYNYFGKKVSKVAIKGLIYRTSGRVLKDVYEMEKESPKNDLAIYLKKKKMKDVAEYFMDAKTVEILCQNDPWYGNETKPELLEKTLKKINTKIKTTTDLMLKQRYAYQAIVLMRYNNKFKEAIDLYNTVFNSIAKKDESIIKYWALMHIATCEDAENNYDKSQLDYAKAFANCNAKKFYSYTQINRSHINKLKETASDNDKLNILLVNSMTNPGPVQNMLEEIAKYDVNSENFKTLLVREVNKYEDWIKTPEISGGGPAVQFRGWTYDKTIIEKNKKEDLENLSKFTNFMKTTVSPKIKDKAFANLVLAHLYYLKNDKANAKKYIKAAAKKVKTKKEKDQLAITRALINTISFKKYNAKFEKAIWKDLKHLIKSNIYNQKRDRSFHNLMLIIEKGYEKQNSIEKVALFKHYFGNSPFLYLDSKGSVSDIKNYMNIFDKWYNTKGLQRFLLKKTHSIDKNRYTDLMGTKMLRQDKLKEALEYYKQIPEDFWKTKYYYNEFLQADPITIDKAPFAIKYNQQFVNKAFFIEKLINLKKEFDDATDERKAMIAILLGNIYYNMSYYGKSWHYIAYGKTASGIKYYPANKNYSDCHTAINYYKKAIALSNDVNTKSMALLLAAGIISDLNYYNEGRTPNSYAINLKNNFNAQYKEYLKECSGLYYYGR